MPEQLPYLPSNKNLEALFSKIHSAKVPERFTHSYLQKTLGLHDRPFIPLLRTLGFIDQPGTPLPTYQLLKNSETAKAAIGQAIRGAYAPLFEADEKAHTHSAEKLKGLVAQVSGTDADMTARIVATFLALVKLGDFSAPPKKILVEEEKGTDKDDEPDKQKHGANRTGGPLRPEFHYNIQVHLPSNGTEEIYLGIFNALRKAFQ